MLTAGINSTLTINMAKLQLSLNYYSPRVESTINTTKFSHDCYSETV